MESLLLASASPRRREILAGLGIPLEVMATDLDESRRDALPTGQRVLALAEDKARAALPLLAARPDRGAAAPRLILAADTLVVIAERILGCGGPGRSGVEAREEVFGKPRDREDARRMIRRLEGREHFVRTGLALLDRTTGSLLSARSDSLVRFSSMSAAEIEAYLATGEWEGVAGGYMVQGAAALFIERIEGSWSGIVGLPIRELYDILARIGYEGLPLRQ